MLRINVYDTDTKKHLFQGEVPAAGVVLLHPTGQLSLVGGLPEAVASYGSDMMKAAWVYPSIKKTDDAPKPHITIARMVPRGGNGRMG